MINVLMTPLWQGAAGNAPIPMASLTEALDRRKNNVQPLKLVFEVKDPDIKSCAQPEP
jgi:hypothetical protein